MRSALIKKRFLARAYAAGPMAFACDEGACGNGKGSSIIELVIVFLFVAVGVAFGSAKIRVVTEPPRRANPSSRHGPVKVPVERWWIGSGPGGGGKSYCFRLAGVVFVCAGCGGIWPQA